MILYIGNNLNTKNTNVTTLQLLTSLLVKEGYNVYISSSINNKILRMLAMCWSVIRYRKKANYILIDTYSTHNFYYAYVVSLLARIFCIKYIPILHGGNLPNRLVKSPNMSRALFKHSYVNVAPSNYLKSAFEKHGFSAMYIPNILEVDKYDFTSRQSFLPKLLYVRSLHQMYNPKMAIRTLATLKKEFPKATLCMVGPYEQKELEECKELVESLHLADQILFKGRLPKAQWHLLAKQYDIFINTTTVDNTPISVMEAMALGLPVVSTKVGGIPYLIEDGVTGVLVSSNAEQEMASAIKKLVANPAIAISIVTRARNKVAQFDWKIVKKQWQAILK